MGINLLFRHTNSPLRLERGFRGEAFFLLFLLPLLFSCTNDAYETGDSRYSYLRTDFVEAYTNADARVETAMTDDDMTLTFPKPFSVSWMAKADTIYRAMLYYNIGDLSNGKQMTAKAISAGRVYVLEPKNISDTTTVYTDPVYFQSAWQSSNGNYLNLSLALMTGVADSVDVKQSIGMVCDTIMTAMNGSHTYLYRFSHSQGGVPQYYKTTIYISIPTKKMTAGDHVRLSINTYDGEVTREFAL